MRRLFPRDTHGDLRLDHVYWFPDGGRRMTGSWSTAWSSTSGFATPTRSPSSHFWRWSLKPEGRRDLADKFDPGLSSCHRSNEEARRPSLPFYRAYRAAVRAKVEGMKLDETEVGETEKSAAEKGRCPPALALGELEEPLAQAMHRARRRPPGNRQLQPSLAHLGRRGGLYGRPIRRGSQRASGQRISDASQDGAREDLLYATSGTTELTKSVYVEPRQRFLKAAACSSTRASDD